MYKKTKNPNNIQTLYEGQNLEKTLEFRNREIYIDYTQGNIFNRNLVFDKTRQTERSFKEAHAQNITQALKMVGNKEIAINDAFAFTVGTGIVNDHDSQTIDEYRLRHDWLK